MHPLKTLGIVLLVAGAIILLLGFFSGQSESLPKVVQDTERNGQVYMAFGAALMLSGLVFVLVERTAEPLEPAGPEEVPQEIEIKRSRMEWSTSRSQVAAVPADDDEVEEVERRMSQVKVRFGMGEIGKEAYRQLMQDLEQEKARAELRRIERRGGL